MTTDRRTFLLSAACAGLGAPLLNASSGTPSPSRKLKILMIGGTRFLGPAVVDAALAKGHEVTLFNRGRSNPLMYPDLEKIRGDRNNPEALAQLKDRKWDVVVDTCGYFPRQIDSMAEALGDNIGQYVFVSTLSVFQMVEGGDALKEDGALAEISDEEAAMARQVTGRNYGALKAKCEARAEAAWPGITSNIRPGLIVGPGDTSDRFTYWPVRVARGGEVLCPDDPNQRVQFIDVRDLGEWIVEVAENKTYGVYNAVGFDGPMTLQEILHGCKIVLGSNATFTWCDAIFLRDNSVNAWGGPSSLPLWDPTERPGFDNSKALAAGMKLRPVGETIRDTYDWVRKSGHLLRGAGISENDEKHVLDAWREQQKKKDDK